MFHTSTRSLGRTIAALTVVCLGLIAAPASATGGGGDPAPCDPKDAWTETVIITPAVPAVPEVPAVPAVTEERMTNPGQPYVAPTEGTPDLWWNWSPNHAQGPQDYVPAFPSDERGTWQGPHENGGPMQDRYGTFQTGGGNSPFFHREQGTEGDPGQPYIAPTYETVVVTPAVPAVPGTPAIPAVTQEVFHPAVTCPPVEDEFPDYEVCALWSVDNPEVADFPQTRVDSEDCTTPPATCEGDQRFQQDYYWIRDAEDEQYLAGLQHLNSPADDARLEPHNYSMIDVPAKTGEDCEPVQPTCETDPTLCPVPPTDVCTDIPGDQSETGECVLIPEEPVLPPNKPEKPTKPSAGPPTTLLTQAPAQPASAAPAPAAQAALPATGAPASLWLVLLGAGLVLGGVALTRRSNA